MNYCIDDTICAPATSSGGAICVVRVSGSGCFAAVDSVVKLRHGSASTAKGFTIRFGVVEGLDEVLVSVFKAPHSYTGEDMAEISCHASPYVVGDLLRRLCDAGCRLAQAGEFTRRAFVASKMDLAQAEAVADLIAADSAAAHRLAFSQLRGAYSEKLRSLRGQILELSALLELELDFSEEELEFADRGRLRMLAEAALAETSRLADSFRAGNAFKKGIPVAIVGAVNSGKSTLLNALLGEERAIVSDIPGTTRDTVEEVLVLNGIAYRFIDTAGLREGAEEIERMGIERSFSQIEKATVVIVLLDGTASVDSLLPVVAEVKARLSDSARVIWVRSKMDLAEPGGHFAGCGNGAIAPGNGILPEAGCKDGAFCTRLGIPDVIDLSSRTGQGLDALKEAVSRPDVESMSACGAVMVTNQRHYEALNSAAEDLRRFLDGLTTALPTDLLSEDLRSATRHLGTIFGEITPDNLLGEIFSRFCIGK
ncbi:MAG: tRNA uridine-5-carboxymethylaminomethyl(34) synthesis GTPase MnmE [Bacteroidales bacterium]|nr:tRNA uridine-5-carboxymethylaminomethyl(34) synthesis GTPase MnmE [Bacteroidales bacterium]